VVITEVRIKLMEDNNENERLQAFCSVTFDDAFVVRDLKIIEGTKGPFVAMPSRKLTDRCQQCGCKNHLRARFCNQCGHKLDENRATRDADGRAKLHADIAHPINSACREVIQTAVLKAFQEEKERSKQPGYVCTYDDFDGDYEGTLTQVVGELNGGNRGHGGPNYRTHPAHAPRGGHAAPTPHEAPTHAAGRDQDRSEGFGAGIL
jgi:stage V sporulation protein G